MTRLAALPSGLAAASLLVAAIAVGSRGGRDFDPALAHYAMASVVALFAIASRWSVWLSRPPTRRSLRRAGELVRAGGLPAASRALALAADRLAAQRFIARRSRLRWATHLCLSWGSMLAFAITFPLVFGWIHFETPSEGAVYRTMVFGVAVAEFRVDSLAAWIAFNALNVSALLVIAGVAGALWRRWGEARDRSLQRFGADVAPLLVLFAVAATGLALTVSARWLDGAGYALAAVAHAATVIGLLLYLPFGKLFHVFQRPAQIGVALYRQAGAAGPAARCLRCGGTYASAMQVDDLRTVLAEVGIDQRLERDAHYQEICPPCRRRLIAIAQAHLMKRHAPRGRGRESVQSCFKTEHGPTVSTRHDPAPTPSPQGERAI
jgi:hypothetical protein